MLHKICSPGLTLLFLAPIIGELLSGSSPPTEFLNPFTLLLLVILYGGGALLTRELAHHWNGGWLTILILGAAYGIAEEGLICKSFFDPNWMDIGILGSYGRWLGVNWVWSLELILFHAVFSTAIPVLLVNLMFPAAHSEIWISRWAFKWLSVLWLVNGTFVYFFISSYRPPLILYMLASIAVVILVAIAWRLPSSISVFDQIFTTHSFWFGLIGYLGTIALFVLAWVFPNAGINPLLTLFFMAFLPLMFSWIILKVPGKGILDSPKHQFALASGALSFFIILAPLQELDKSRTDNTSGMTFVSLLFVIFLIWLGWHINHRGSREIS